MIIRILVLGDSRVVVPKDLKDAPELEFEFTCEAPEEIMTRGYYTVSHRSLQLAQEATTDKYDAIIIGNNLGTGLDKADRVLPDMRDRTMIVWNRYSPGNERAYANMGFTRFGQRHSLGDEATYAIGDFLRELVTSKSSAAE